MSAPILCDREDAAVVREKGYQPALMDCNGDVLFRFPDHWSEADAFQALAIANQAFETGYFRGRGSLRADLRALLDMGSST